MYTHILFLCIKGYQMFRNFMCDVTNHKPFGFGLTAVNEVRRHIVFNIPMIVRYTTYDIELPYPGLYPFPIFLQEFLQDLIIGFTYLGSFYFPVIFLYPVKSLIQKSAYLFERNNIYKNKLSALNDSYYILTVFWPNNIYEFTPEYSWTSFFLTKQPLP